MIAVVLNINLTWSILWIIPALACGLAIFSAAVDWSKSAKTRNWKGAIYPLIMVAILLAAAYACVDRI